MGNQQVTELYYKLETIKSVNFNSPPSLEGEIELFQYSLDNGKLIIKLKKDYSSVEEARKLVEDYLQSWEIDDALEHGIKRINFKHENAKIIDPNNPNAIIIPFRVGSVGGVPFNLIFSEPCYPKPPTLFQLSADVRTLWHRYEGYLENHEPLQSMAFFCLTLLEFRSGGKPKARNKAEQKYKIDYQVLDKLGNLTDQGDEKTARKFKTPVPLSAKKEEWIKVAVRKIIHRVWEIDNGNTSNLPVIKMDNLPTI